MANIDRAFIEAFEKTSQRTNGLKIAPRDVGMYSILFNKDIFISSLMRQFEIIAIDCVLQQARNMYPETDNYSDHCYYELCNYVCSSGFKYPADDIIKQALEYNNNPDFKIDDSTYLSYYLALDIQRIDKYITNYLIDLINQDIYSITDITLYNNLISTYPELDHQRMKLTYFTTALNYMAQSQHIIELENKPRLYIKYEKPIVYLALNYKSQSVIDSYYSKNLNITAIQNTDLIVENHIRQYSTQKAQALIAKISSAQTEAQMFSQIDALSANLKSSLFEYVYDDPRPEAQKIKQLMIDKYPDRIYTVPYLYESMKKYYDIITGNIVRRGRPRTRKTEGRDNVNFNPKDLSPLDEDQPYVQIHIFNLTISSSNVIASLIKPSNTQVRIYLAGEEHNYWTDVVYPPDAIKPEDMSNVYLAYIFNLRKQEQLNIMARALKETEGIYGYRINSKFYLARTTLASYQSSLTKKTGATRDEKKGQVMTASYNGLSEYSIIAPIYKQKYGNAELTFSSLHDLPIMLQKLDVVMYLTANITN